MRKHLLAAALCAASPLAAMAAMPEIHTRPIQPAPAEISVIVDLGLTSVCGLREGPHLIEHLMLSGTKYGQTPPDVMKTLSARGLTVAAMTHADFTEFKIAGSESQLEEMAQVMADLLQPASLPRSGFEREKAAILNELHADQGYRSRATLFERFIGEHTDAAIPCAGDTTPFAQYDYDTVNKLYQSSYTAERMKVIAVANVTAGRLDSLVEGIKKREATNTASSHIGLQELATPPTVMMVGNTVEVIVAIDGRKRLPADAAQALADNARYALQAHVREKYNLYSARSFVNQSLEGGWIRFEVPKLPVTEQLTLLPVISSALSEVQLGKYINDPIWHAFGAQKAVKPIGEIMFAIEKPVSDNWLSEMVEIVKATTFWRWIFGSK